MSRTNYRDLVLVDPDEVTNINEVQKRHLLESGQLPYRNSQGKIKWLNNEQRSYKLMKSVKPNIIHQFFGPKVQSRARRRRKHRPAFIKMLLANWLFISILVIIVALVIVSIKYSYLFL